MARTRKSKDMTPFATGYLRNHDLYIPIAVLTYLGKPRVLRLVHGPLDFMMVLSTPVTPAMPTTSSGGRTIPSDVHATPTSVIPDTLTTTVSSKPSDVHMSAGDAGNAVDEHVNGTGERVGAVAENEGNDGGPADIFTIHVPVFVYTRHCAGIVIKDPDNMFPDHFRAATPAHLTATPTPANTAVSDSGVTGSTVTNPAAPEAGVVGVAGKGMAAERGDGVVTRGSDGKWYGVYFETIKDGVVFQMALMPEEEGAIPDPGYVYLM